MDTVQMRLQNFGLRGVQAARNAGRRYGVDLEFGAIVNFDVRKPAQSYPAKAVLECVTRAEERDLLGNGDVFQRRIGH